MDTKNPSASSVKQTEIVERITDLVLQRVFIAIGNRLDKEGQTRMEQVFAGDNDREKLQFIEENAPDFGELLKTEALNTIAEVAEKTTKTNP